MGQLFLDFEDEGEIKSVPIVFNEVVEEPIDKFPRVELPDGADVLSYIERYQRHYLVSCYAYYELGQHILEDKEYEHRYRILYALMRDNPEEAKLTKYYSLTNRLDGTYTGEGITHPPEIISKAYHLLFMNQTEEKSIQGFVSRWGVS
jgi:NAD-dependent DNA ligase